MMALRNLGPDRLSMPKALPLPRHRLGLLARAELVLMEDILLAEMHSYELGQLALQMLDVRFGQGTQDA
jgi:hypothetical protein